MVISRINRALVAALAALAAGAALAIVNGTTASDERYAAEFGWAVVLQYPGSDSQCTGQLIAPEWVLTAAHCAAADARVLSGQADRTGAPVAAAAAAYVHPGYVSATGENDIGLVRLARPLTRPVVPLLERAEAPALLREGARGIIAGWGRRTAGAGYAERLVVSDVELRALRQFPGRFGYYDAASGPCGGDSGGPLLLQRADGRWVLAGIASRVQGDPCAQGGGVAIYVNVAEMRDFIRRHVGPPGS